MNITANRLTATAGLCAAAAGAIFIGVQINHPPADVAHVVTTEMPIRESAKALMSRPGAGRLHRHVPPPPPPVRRPRARRLPAADRRLPRDLRRPVHRRLRPPDRGAARTRATSRTSSTPPSAAARAATSATCSELFLVSGIGYSLGGLLFGIALFRAGVLARWACAAARLRHHLRPRAGRAAGVLQPPVRGAHRRRADRPRRLAVARPAPAGRDRRRAGDGVGRGAGDPMSTRERSWPVPVALVALSAIPLTAGTLRLIQLAGGPAVIPADHRFAGFPIPLVVHILGAATVRARRDPAVRATVPPPAPGLAPSCRPGAWSWPGCWWRSRRSG